MSNPFIGAYWGERAESRSQCAERYAKLLELLQNDPHLSRWFFLGGSARKPPKPVPTDSRQLEAHLETHNRDTDKTPIVELGFSLTIWNGKEDETCARLAVSCGGFGYPTRNTAILDMPECKYPPSAHLEDYRTVLQSIIDCYDPDKAVVSSLPRMKKYTPETWSYNGYLNYKKGGKVTEGEPD